MPAKSKNKSSANDSQSSDDGTVVALPLKRKPRRVYKESVSHNRFGCRGRVITGPDRKFFWLALLMIIIPSIAFLAAVYPNLIRHLSLGWVVIIGHVAFSALILTSFFLTSFTDPGIIPRKPVSQITPVNPFDAPPPAHISTTINSGTVKIQFQRKYCDTCDIYRPVRSIHCGVCNNCVEEFDHHCPWVGNCIGKRNYRYFLVFIFSVLMGLMYVQAFCIVDLVIRNHNRPKGKEFDYVLHNPASLLIILYSLGVEGLVGSLAVYHCYLVSKGVTTNESIKDIFIKKNPYHRGFCRNWIHACFPPMRPKYVKWDHKIQSEDLRALPPLPDQADSKA